MDKKYQIFISSTYEDLKEERSKVVATILKDFHFPIGMEMFSADNIEQWEQIKRTIDSSDYYILIIKRRYGSLTKEGISYTEKEYDYAKSRNIPVLAFIVDENAIILSKDIENDPIKMEKLKQFVEKVKKANPCDFWENADSLCTCVSQALRKQFDRNQRAGWIRNEGIAENEKLENINTERLVEINKRIEYELLRRKGDIRLAYDFRDTVDEKLWHCISKETYIDNFIRQIVIEFTDNHNAKINISTQIEYMNVKSGINYYSANPRFETKEQAESYKHEEFYINRIDCLDNIVSDISYSPGRQFSYIVNNEIPLLYDRKNVIISHKISYIVPAEKFFHVYQLVFPCRSFLTTIMLKNNIDEKYRIRTGTFSSFNVHAAGNENSYRTEYRKGDIGTITISKWSLPGSGYSVLLQRNH
mgnify:CR=1 FL=1